MLLVTTDNQRKVTTEEIFANSVNSENAEALLCITGIYPSNFDDFDLEWIWKRPTSTEFKTSTPKCVSQNILVLKNYLIPADRKEASAEFKRFFSK